MNRSQSEDGREVVVDWTGFPTSTRAQIIDGVALIQGDGSQDAEDDAPYRSVFERVLIAMALLSKEDANLSSYTAANLKRYVANLRAIQAFTDYHLEFFGESKPAALTSHQIEHRTREAARTLLGALERGETPVTESDVAQAVSPVTAADVAKCVKPEPCPHWQYEPLEAQKLATCVLPSGLPYAASFIEMVIKHEFVARGEQGLIDLAKRHSWPSHLPLLHVALNEGTLREVDGGFEFSDAEFLD